MSAHRKRTALAALSWEDRLPLPILQLAYPLTEQIIAIIQRDQAAYLAQVNPTNDQSGPQLIQEFHLGPRYRTGFPWLTVAYRDTNFDPDSQEVTMQDATYRLELEIGNFDSEWSQKTAIQWMAILDAIFRSAGPPYSYTDWTTSLPISLESSPSGFTTPLPAGAVKWVFIRNEQLQLVQQQEMEQPIISVTMELFFRFGEYIPNNA